MSVWFRGSVPGGFDPTARLSTERHGMEFNHLVVTTDFSEQAKRGHAVAAQLARQFGASLILAHVAESPSEFFLRHGVGAAAGIPRAPYIASLRERLEEEAADDVFEGLSVEPVLLEGSPSHQELNKLAQAREAELIVAASSGHSALGRLLLGSFTEKLIRYSSVPVLAVRPTDKVPWEPKRVVIPIDFSGNSKAVLPIVHRLSKEFQSTFLFVYVLDAEAPLLEVPPPMGVDFAARIYEETPERVRASFRELQKTELEGVAAEFTVLRGRHYREITRFAEEEEADLILLSTHGWTGIDHLIMGSVAERVSRGAPCSVLAVHPQRKTAEDAPASASTPAAE